MHFQLAHSPTRCTFCNLCLYFEDYLGEHLICFVVCVVHCGGWRYDAAELYGQIRTGTLLPKLMRWHGAQYLPDNFQHVS